jgi:hypothetical protein
MDPSRAPAAARCLCSPATPDDWETAATPREVGGAGVGRDVVKRVVPALNVVLVAVSVMIEHVCRRAIYGRSSLGDGIGLRMLSFSGSMRVFVAVEACDMRKV